MSDLNSYKVSTKDKDNPFPENPIGRYLYKRNAQSIRGLWNRLCRKYDLYAKSSIIEGTTVLYKKETHKKIFSFIEFLVNVRLSELYSCFWCCVSFYSVKQIYKISRENHWMNKQIFKEIEEIIIQNLQNT